MKQIYNTPSVEVITLKTQQFMMMSLQGDTTATSGNLSREFDYEDEEEYEDY